MSTDEKPLPLVMRRCVVCSTEFKVHKNSPSRTCSEACFKKDKPIEREIEEAKPTPEPPRERKMEIGKTVEIIYPESIPAEILIKALQTGLANHRWTSFDGKIYQINIESISGDYHDQKIILDKSHVETQQDA